MPLISFIKVSIESVLEGICKFVCCYNGKFTPHKDGRILNHFVKFRAEKEVSYIFSVVFSVPQPYYS